MPDYIDKERLLKSHFNYTNESNPFGDAKLTQPFIWAKKNNQPRADPDDIKNKIAEIDAVKRRREQRELEENLLEAHKAELLKKKDIINIDDWEEKESKFFQQQLVIKSLLHIERGEEQFIDTLVKIIKIYQGHKFKNIGLPSMDKLLSDFKELPINIMETLFNDIEQHESIEIIDKSYWTSIAIYLKDNTSYEDGILKSVTQAVDDLLSNKSQSELDEFEIEIEEKLDNAGQSNVNISFWESVLNKIPIFRAKLEFEKYFSKAKLESDLAEFECIKREKSKEIVEDTCKKVKKEVNTEVYVSYSPLLLPDDPSLHAISEMEYEESLEEERERARSTQAALEAKRVASSELNNVNRDFEAFVANEKLNMDKDEQIMHDCLEQRTNEHDKFSLRKPRFFNRIRTGYDWTKYNQMHYDEDNPPPKLVQGYKFNIFYPDLLDPTKPPRWILERDSQCEDAEFPETTIIRFIAGAPYQDLTFRIINKEWSLDKNKGFKNIFERGILQLHFNFKKMRYRR